MEIGDRCLTELSELPVNDDNFGLIHSDVDAGNFFYENGTMTFFDFDDCCYQWFGFDVAFVLFNSVFIFWMDNSQTVREKAARGFLPAFFDGYSSVLQVDNFMLERMTLFLKVLPDDVFLKQFINIIVRNTELIQYLTTLFTQFRCDTLNPGWCV